MYMHFLTEQLSLTHASELTIWIYKIPLQNQHDRHKAGYYTAYQLKGLNQNEVIVFNDSYIASFSQISNWASYEHVSEEHRTIQLQVHSERRLLERLIQLHLITHMKAKSSFVLNNRVFVDQKTVDQLFINKYIAFDTNVSEKGEIIIGFDSKHQFVRRDNLLQHLQKKQALKPKTRVTDGRFEYRLHQIADYTIYDTCPYLNQSVADYLSSRNQAYRIEGLPHDTKVIHVENVNGDILSYSPSMLREVCHYDAIDTQTRRKVNPIIKQSLADRFSFLFRKVNELLDHNGVLTFKKENVKASHLGYEIKHLKNPQLLFNKDKVENKPYHGLAKYGCYEEKEMTFTVLLDPKLKKKEKEIGHFIHTLMSAAKQLGVSLKIAKKTSDFHKKQPYDFFTSDTLSYDLKTVGDQFDTPVLAIIDRSNMDQAYHEIKKQFGGKEDLITQLVNDDPAFFHDPLANKYKLYNILLGLFVKEGLQPWVLHTKLHSDCFIGLDVSHIDGKHSSGIIQIIGNDGRTIKQAALSRTESGEKLSNESMEEIIHDAIFTFEKTYDYRPKHITIHRDGRSFEDLPFIQTLAKRLQVKIDYVEITKQMNRRMVSYSKPKWFTVQGLTYIKENYAYLCATSPHAKVGIAQPIKIVQLTDNLNIEEIVKDVYALSFMHIHSLNKTRLPVTTYYADLSSTFHNKNYMKVGSKHESSLAFV